jgi:hypothetical protein
MPGADEITVHPQVQRFFVRMSTHDLPIWASG